MSHIFSLKNHDFETCSLVAVGMDTPRVGVFSSPIPSLPPGATLLLLPPEPPSVHKTSLDMCFCSAFRLHLDLEVTAVAMTILQRFMCIYGGAYNTLPEAEIKLVVATCLFLASKIGESPRRLRDVINVTHRLTWFREHPAAAFAAPAAKRPRLCSRTGNTKWLFSASMPSVQFVVGGEQSDESDRTEAAATAFGGRFGGALCLDHDYWQLKERVVHTEQHVLRALAFDLAVDHPFRFLAHFARFVQCPRRLLCNAWSIALDTLWSPACCLDTNPHDLAAAIIFIAWAPPALCSSLVRSPTAFLKRRRPAEPELRSRSLKRMQRVVVDMPWWQCLGVNDAQLEAACASVLKARIGRFPEGCSLGI